MAERPNVILITTDQQRFDAMGLNRPDFPLRTPNLDSLAARGMNFTRAYTTCPVCIPARRSLLTGLHPATHGLRGYRDGLEWDPPFTLPGLLAGEGYQTQLIGKLHLYPQRKRYGFQHMIRTESPNDRWDTELQGVNDWADWLKQEGVTQFPNNIGINGNGRLARPFDMEERYHHSSWLTDRAVEFVTKRRDPTAPFFLHLSYWAPHPPLTPPQAYWDRYDGRHDYRPHLSEWTPQFNEVPRGIHDDRVQGPFELEEMQRAASGYFGLINHIDDRVRYFLERCFGYGSPRAQEPALILFTSDHGEMLGDHHLWRKSLPYESSSHVPFFAYGHRMEIANGTCDALVSLEDVCPTVLDMCGIDVPDALSDPLDGQSLAPALRGSEVRTRDTLYGECRGFDHQFVLQDRWKYIWFAKTGEEQLFDLVSDPDEHTDLSGSSDRVGHFRQLLATHLEGRDDYAFDPAACRPCDNGPPRAIWDGYFGQGRGDRS